MTDKTPDDATSLTWKEKELIEYANRTPKLLSLLYDADMMPEQLSKEGWLWWRMIALIRSYRGQENKP